MPTPGRINCRAFVSVALPFTLAALAAIPPIRLAEASKHVSGAWSDTVDIGIQGVNIALVRGSSNTSKVLMYGGSGINLHMGVWSFTPSGSLSLPRGSSLRPVFFAPGDASDIFCSGFCTLGDGRLLIASGEYVPSVGTEYSYTYDGAGPDTLRKQADLAQGHWYPTLTALSDGTALCSAGWRYPNVVLFGGRASTSETNDFFSVTRGDESRWISPIEDDSFPSSREGQSFCWDMSSQFAFDRHAIVFGGDTNGDTADGKLNDVWSAERTRTDTTWAWKEEVVDPDVYTAQLRPARRSGHSAILSTAYRDSNMMIIFGGVDSDGNALNDVWKLHRYIYSDEAHYIRYPRYRWNMMKVTNPPPARYGHTAIYDSGDDHHSPRMIVCGGTNGTTTFNDTWILPLDTTMSATWTQATNAASENLILLGGRTYHVATTLDAPAGTHVHEQPVSPEPAEHRTNVMLMFGGRDTTGALKQDLRLLSRLKDSAGDEWKWDSLPAATGAFPAPREKHAAAHDFDWNRLVLFGGKNASGSDLNDLWGLDLRLTPPKWATAEMLESSPSPPSARHGLSALFDVRNINALVPERFSDDGWQTRDGAAIFQLPYPFMFQMPDHYVLNAGPFHDSTSYVSLLDVDEAAWDSTKRLVSQFEMGSAVMYRPGKILRSGSLASGDGYIGSRFSDTLAYGVAGSESSWVLTSNLHPMSMRANHNLTVLPTGDVLVTGGLRYAGAQLSNSPSRRPQLWHASGPFYAQWSDSDSLAPDPAIRNYHSAAILLPDGRILSTGGEYIDKNPYMKRATIYEPPYLFDPDTDEYAARPSILGMPDALAYGQFFKMCSCDAIESMCLIRPGAATHAFNQNQLFVPLSFTHPTAGQFRAKIPASQDSVPPGDYMLFVVSTAHVPSVAHWVRIRAGSDVADVTCESDCSPPEEGCPVVESRTESGWQKENTILGRSLSGALEFDDYRLKNAPEPTGGVIDLRIRENEQELTALDQVRLIAVDHAPGIHAYAVGEQVRLGTRASATRVTTTAGDDVTALVSGSSGQFFQGQLGDTLLVDLAGQTTMGASAVSRTTEEGGSDGFLFGGGDKPSDGELRAGPELSGQGLVGSGRGGRKDALILEGTGVLIQVPDGEGAWRTAAHVYPREQFDERLLDSLETTTLRLIFIGKHRVNYLGAFHAVSDSLVAHKLPLLSAQHTRLGDVFGAVEENGNLSTELAPGDTIALRFGWSGVPEGQVRELFLLSHGVYTSSLPAKQEVLGSQLPITFALRQNQPNPFATRTTIRFELPVRSPVKLEIFDAQGRKVRTLVDGSYPAGYHTAVWDQRDGEGRSAGPGVYFYRMTTGAFSDRRKMVLLSR